MMRAFRHMGSLARREGGLIMKSWLRLFVVMVAVVLVI